MRPLWRLGLETLIVLLLLALLACTHVEAQGQSAMMPLSWQSEPVHPEARWFEYTTYEHHRQFALSMEAFPPDALGGWPLERMMPREMFLRKTRFPLEDGSAFLEIHIDSTRGYPEWMEWPARIVLQPGLQEHYSRKGDLLVRYSEEIPPPADWNFDPLFDRHLHPGMPSFALPSDRELAEQGYLEVTRDGESMRWIDDQGIEWTMDPEDKIVELKRETRLGWENEIDVFQHFQDVGFLQTYRLKTIDLSDPEIPVRLVEEEIILSHSLWHDGSVKADPDLYANALRLYPNPVKGRLNIEWKYNLDVLIFTVVVRQANGTVVAVEQLGGVPWAQINANGWPSGLLWVEIQTAQGVFHRLISKQ
ncbi:hypothetical protein GC167_06100 [bacterium]|nr:hypothetical protein [bacterium]